MNEEILSGAVPFPHMKVTGAIVLAVCVKNARPTTLPAESPSGESYTLLWTIAQLGWSKEPTERPTMTRVREMLSKPPADAAVDNQS